MHRNVHANARLRSVFLVSVNLVINNFKYLSIITLQYKVVLSTRSCKFKKSIFRREEILGNPVRLRSTETQSTYNIVVEVEDVIDVHCASLTSQGVQDRVFYLDMNLGEQAGSGVFPLVIAVPYNIAVIR